MAKTAVIIPSANRAPVLYETVFGLTRQKTPPEEVILSITNTADVTFPYPSCSGLKIKTVVGPRGLTAQRNSAIARVSAEIDYILFLDDDVELSPDYLATCEAIMATEPRIALLAGGVVAEGVDRSTARSLIKANCQNRSIPRILPAESAYGCNMFVRAPVARQVRFDENLVLYGWLEDYDWSVRVRAFGEIGLCPQAFLVHLKVSTGRISGARFGYSQIANPHYLYQKGTITSLRVLCLQHFLPAPARNALGCLLRDRRVDRSGRLRGNFVAFCDVIRGKAHPKRILSM